MKINSISFTALTLCLCASSFFVGRVYTNSQMMSLYGKEVKDSIQVKKHDIDTIYIKQTDTVFVEVNMEPITPPIDTALSKKIREDALVNNYIKYVLLNS